MAIAYETRWQSFHVWHRKKLGAFPQHLHSYIEIIYVKSGHSRCSVDFTEYELHSGDVMFIFPEQIHAYGQPSGPVENYALLFPGNIPGFTEVFEKMLPVCPILHGAVTKEIEALFQIAYKTKANRKAPYAVGAAQGYIAILLSKLLPLLPLQPIQDGEKNLARSLVTYCTAHFCEPITLRDVAGALGYSPTYISHIFSEKFKVGFSKFINTLRVEEAKKALRTEKSITEIAFACGFGGQRSFNRVFKEATGKTPSEYRKSKK